MGMESFDEPRWGIRVDGIIPPSPIFSTRVPSIPQTSPPKSAVTTLDNFELPTSRCSGMLEANALFGRFEA